MVSIRRDAVDDDLPHRRSLGGPLGAGRSASSAVLPRSRTRPTGPSDADPSYTRRVTDHDDLATGAPVLDRQARPVRLDVRGRPLVPSRVAEERPTPLRDSFIYVSIVALVCGVISIVALELGTPFSSWLVRVPILVGGVCLLAVTTDAIVRIGRSVGAWMPVHPPTAWFRVVWVVVLVSAAIATLVVMVAAVVA